MTQIRKFSKVKIYKTALRVESKGVKEEKRKEKWRRKVKIKMIVPEAGFPLSCHTRLPGSQELSQVLGSPDLILIKSVNCNT